MADTNNNSAWNNLTTSQGSYDKNLVKTWQDEFETLFARFKKNDDKVRLVSPGIRHSILVLAAKQRARDETVKFLRKQLESHETQQEKIAKANREQYLAALQKLNQKLVERGRAVHEDYGEINALSSGSGKIKAIDQYGHKVDGALIMWYEAGREIEEVTEIYNPQSSESTQTSDTSSDTKSRKKNKNPEPQNIQKIQSTKFKTDKVFVIDLAPQIKIQSSKNIVLTKVQGRDYTRKELVSGGDLCFSVSGEIVSHHAGVYPQRDVQKFLDIMQHNGIISVNNLMFGQCKVKQVIIQSFNLETPKYCNVQPYSFTCVAVEPKESIQIVNDTIEALNISMTLTATERKQKWYNLVLNNFLNDIDSVTQKVVGSAISSTLDGLTYNI